MKHTLSLSVMLSLCLIGGTLYAPANKRVANPNRPAVVDLGQALSRFKKDKNQDNFNLIVEAHYETLRPVGSKHIAGEFEDRAICVKSIERAAEAALKMGVAKADVDAFKVETEKKCGISTRKAPIKPSPIKPGPGNSVLDQHLVNALKSSLRNLPKITLQNVFDQEKKDMLDLIVDYKNGDYKNLANSDKKVIDDLEVAIKAVNFAGAGGGTKTDWSKIAGKVNLLAKLDEISNDAGNQDIMINNTKPKADAEALYKDLVAGYKAAKAAGAGDLELAAHVGNVSLIVDTHALNPNQYPKI